MVVDEEAVAIAYTCAKNYTFRMRGILEFDELASEAILALAKARLTYSPERNTPFCKYAYMLIYRHFIDIYRKHVRRVCSALDEEGFFQEDPLLALVEDLEDISLFLQKLPPVEQTLLLLRLEEYTQQECSRILKQQFGTCGTQNAVSTKLKKIGEIYQRMS